MSTSSKRFHRIIHSSNRRRGAAAAAAGPTYSSGTIGAVGASAAVYSETVEITFSEDMATTGSDYTTGVTIKVGTDAGVFITYTISSGAIQADESKVRYVLAAGVDGTETVTWEYDGSGPIKSKTGGVQLGVVSAQEVTNTAFEPHDLLGTSKYWWHVRPSGSDNGVAGSDGDAIASWPEDGGSNAFVQATTNEKPTLLRDNPNNINGLPVLEFEGGGSGDDDNMSVNPPDFEDMFGASSALKTAWFVVKVAAMGTSADWYLNRTIMTTSDGYWGVTVNDDSIIHANYDSNNDTIEVLASASPGVYVVEVRHDATGDGIFLRLNGGTEVDTASGATNATGDDDTMVIGENYNGTAFFSGYIAEIVTSNENESDANRTKMRNVLRNIYGV
jgi:hypothetical protein